MQVESSVASLASGPGFELKERFHMAHPIPNAVLLLSCLLVSPAAAHDCWGGHHCEDGWCCDHHYGRSAPQSQGACRLRTLHRPQRSSMERFQRSSICRELPPMARWSRSACFPAQGRTLVSWRRLGYSNRANSAQGRRHGFGDGLCGQWNGWRSASRDRDPERRRAPCRKRYARPSSLVTKRYPNQAVCKTEACVLLQSGGLLAPWSIRRRRRPGVFQVDRGLTGCPGGTR